MKGDRGRQGEINKTVLGWTDGLAPFDANAGGILWCGGREIEGKKERGTVCG